MNQRCTRSARRSRGAALVVAMLVLVLCAALGTRLARSVASERRLTLTRQHESQADWLAASGLARARARLAADAGYAGETWSVPADELGGAHAAAVEIRIEAIESEAAGRRIIAQAEYPTGAAHRVRRTHEITLQLPERGEEP